MIWYALNDLLNTHTHTFVQHLECLPTIEENMIQNDYSYSWCNQNTCWVHPKVYTANHLPTNQHIAGESPASDPSRQPRQVGKPDGSSLYTTALARVKAPSWMVMTVSPMQHPKVLTWSAGKWWLLLPQWMAGSWDDSFTTCLWHRKQLHFKCGGPYPHWAAAGVPGSWKGSGSDDEWGSIVGLTWCTHGRRMGDELYTRVPQLLGIAGTMRCW